MRFLVPALVLVVSACGGGPEGEAERALRRAAPRAYRAFAAARDARDAILQDGGAALQGAVRARERADHAVSAAERARNAAGVEASEAAANEAGYEEANAVYERFAFRNDLTREQEAELARARAVRDRALSLGSDARRRAEAAATDAFIEAREARERIYRKTNHPAVEALGAAGSALWQAERRLCRTAPGPWRLYVEVMDLDGAVVPPCG